MDISTEENNNISIEFHQFNEHFSDTGIHESIAENIFQQIDTNVDGRISSDEFLQWREKFTFDHFKNMSHKVKQYIIEHMIQTKYTFS